MKTEISIPKSAASRNLMLCLIMLSITGLLGLFNLPMWLVVPAGGIALGFLLAAVYCVLDIQEFTMKQNQKIIELLMNGEKHA